MTINFYKFPVTTQVFHVTKHTFALVNLKPIVPGHVLIVPFRQVSRLNELPDFESIDFFQTVQRVQKFIQHIYCCDGLNFGIQDGIAAGQSVPHVHCHIVPRFLKDGWGDGIYEALENNEGMMKKDFMCKEGWWKDVGKDMNIENDEDRKPRSMEVMKRETEWLKKELKEWLIKNNEWKEEYEV
jgi:bis(5'-adenosyl)-triphosphatase